MDAKNSVVFHRLIDNRSMHPKNGQNFFPPRPMSEQLGKAFDYHRITEQLIDSFRHHNDSEERITRRALDAIHQVPGLEAVLYPAMKNAGFGHTIPQQAVSNDAEVQFV